MTDYENYALEEDENEGTEKENSSFEIVSDLQAEWAIKKIKKATEEHERLVKLAMQEIDEITARTVELNKKLESDTGFLKGKLFEYFNKVEHKETKTQEVYKLLSGYLVMKKPCIKLDRPSDDDLIQIMEETCETEYIENIQKPKWGEYKKTLKITDDGQVVNQDGEVINIGTKEEPAEFTVKF
jgi:hypothetical protein